MRRRKEFDLEAELRAAHSEPRGDFVADVARRIAKETRPSYRPWSRIAFAASISTLVLGMVAALGGVGYAQAGASGTYHAAKKIITHHSLTVRNSSGDDEYNPGNGNENQGANTEGVNANAAAGVAESQGELPFTGISLVAAVALGLALFVTGLVLRRRERRQT